MAKTDTPVPNPSLYDLTLAIAQVNTWAQEESAALDGELPEWLEALQLEAEEDLTAKLERIRRFVGAQEREIGAIDGEMKAVRVELERLAERRTTRENRIARVKRYVVALLGVNGLKKIETPLGAISKQANGGLRAFEIMADADVLAQYEQTKGFVRTVTPEPYQLADQDGLRKMLEAIGADELTIQDPEHAEDNILPPVIIVKLAPRGEHVRFR